MRWRISAEFSPMPAVKTSAVDPAEDGGERADLLGGAVDEVVHRQARRRLGAVEQVAHVVADAGNAEQARLLVEHRLDFVGREPEALEEIEDDAGIERARPRAHAEAVERGEAERAVDALAVLQGAQAGAAAEVRDDDAAVGDLRRDLAAGPRRCTRTTGRESRSAARRRRADLARQRHQLGDRRLAAMKAGVEAGDLRHVRAAARTPLRSPRGCAADAAAPAGSASRSSSSTSRRDDGRAGVPRAAVHDAVADAEHARAAVLRAQPARRAHRAPRARRAPTASSVSSASAGAGASFAEKRGEVPMPSIWPRASSRQASASGLPIDAELQARRAGVEHECVVVHGRCSADADRSTSPWSACRRAWAASIATAQLAIRDRTLSARLVRMIGTRAPSTRPALSALARKLSCLARMLPASRSGASRMSGSPATSDVMPLIFAASLADRVVEGQRAVEHAAVDLPALGHLAQRGGVDAWPASSR